MESKMASPISRCTVPVEIGGKICEFGLRPDRYYSRVPVDIWRLFKTALRPLPPADQVAGNDDLTGCLGMCIGELVVLNRNLTDHTVVVSRELVPTIGLSSLMDLRLIFNFGAGTFKLGDDSLLEGKRQRADSPFERSDNPRSFDKRKHHFDSPPHRQQERYYERDNERWDDRFDDPRRLDEGRRYQDDRLQYRDDQRDDRVRNRRDDNSQYREDERDDRPQYRDEKRSRSPLENLSSFNRGNSQGEFWNSESRTRSPQDAGKFNPNRPSSRDYFEADRMRFQQEFVQTSNKVPNRSTENWSGDPFGRTAPNPETFRNEPSPFRQGSGFEERSGADNFQRFLSEKDGQKTMFPSSQNKREDDRKLKPRLRCNNCRKYGHATTECRLPVITQTAGIKKRPHCELCNKFGHEAATCHSRFGNVSTSNSMSKPMPAEQNALNPWDSWLRSNSNLNAYETVGLNLVGNFSQMLGGINRL